MNTKSSLTQTLEKPLKYHNECRFSKKQIQILYLKNDKHSIVEAYESNNLPYSEILEHLNNGESVFITNKTNNTENPKEKEDLRKKFVTDVKKHISDIAKKYILPDEKTFDFALMYVPAENIYYETILKEENLGEDRSIFSYAIQKRVIPVSPNSFFAYLQVIVLGLKGFQIEKSAQAISQSISRLQGDLGLNLIY